MPDSMPAKLYLLIRRDTGKFIPSLDARAGVESYMCFFTRREAEISKREHESKYNIIADILEVIAGAYGN